MFKKVLAGMTVLGVMATTSFGQLGGGSQTGPIYPQGYSYMYDFYSAGTNATIGGIYESTSVTMFVPSSMQSGFDFPYFPVSAYEDTVPIPEFNAPPNDTSTLDLETNAHEDDTLDEDNYRAFLLELVDYDGTDVEDDVSIEFNGLDSIWERIFLQLEIINLDNVSLPLDFDWPTCPNTIPYEEITLPPGCWVWRVDCIVVDGVEYYNSGRVWDPNCWTPHWATSFDYGAYANIVKNYNHQSKAIIHNFWVDMNDLTLTHRDAVDNAMMFQAIIRYEFVQESYAMWHTLNP